VIEKLLVNEGDDVDAGATLAILDNQARRQAALEEAQARLAAAEARLQQIKAGAKVGDIEAQQAAVNMAEAQSKVAARDLNRAKELHAKQAISIELVDQRQWEFDRLQLEQRRATGTLESLKEIRDVDVAVAEKDITGARAAVARTQADLDASVVTAPASGRILKIHTHPGEKLNERGVLEMGDVLRMQAVAEVFEADVSLIETGMKAEIRIDSSGHKIEGTVIEIGNLVSRKVVLTNDPVSDTDARVVEVRIDLNSDQIESVSRLANARVEVTILLEGPEPQSTEAAQGSVQTISHQSAR
jgi:HlyD family secretion protein